MESKKIVKVENRHNGHLLLEFADNTMQMIVRGEHEEHELQVGDYWPPTKEPRKFVTSKVLEVTSTKDGHNNLRLENGTNVLIERGKRVPRVGDLYPVEESHAVDTQTSEEVALEGEPVVIPATGTDESGAALESQDGPRQEGQPDLEAPTT